VTTNLDINNLFDTIPEDFDATFTLEFVNSLELSFLLPVVHRANSHLRESDEELITIQNVKCTYDYCDSDDDGDTLHPIDRWLIAFPRSTNILEKT
jgi:hypothetical protein